MYTTHSKKQSLLYIFSVLYQFSDKDHRLSQKMIRDLISREYQVELDRKVIRRDLVLLAEFINEITDFPMQLHYSTVSRKTSGRSLDREDVESSMLSDFYLEHIFDTAELRLLIDSLLFSRNLNKKDTKEIVQKLERLTSNGFKSNIGYIEQPNARRTDNEQVLNSIDLLCKAIEQKKKVKFKYTKYGVDQKLHHRVREDGSVREYVVSPYQLATKSGFYFLILNNDNFSNLSNYRIDRIQDIEVLDESIRPIETLSDQNGQRLDLSDYMNKHIYMYSGKNNFVRFSVPEDMLDDVMDYFGRLESIQKLQNGRLLCSANVNEESMLIFAKQYSPDVLINSPESLKQKLRQELEKTLDFYKLFDSTSNTLAQ